MAIKSFGDKATSKLWAGQRVRSFEQIAKSARKRLAVLDAAATLADLAAVPGNQLAKKVGALEGLYSIRVSDKWRITFRWTPEGPEDVTLTDYHDRI